MALESINITVYLRLFNSLAYSTIEYSHPAIDIICQPFYDRMRLPV